MGICIEWFIGGAQFCDKYTGKQFQTSRITLEIEDQTEELLFSVYFACVSRSRNIPYLAVSKRSKKSKIKEIKIGKIMKGRRPYRDLTVVVTTVCTCV